jgi:hypothetical protein
LSCALGLSSLAHAGSYLNRAALLISQTRHESAFLRRHLTDEELARLVHDVCLARVETARQMLVPKEARLAHPHILLMLENYERAAHFAAEKNYDEFVSYTRRAQDEEQIFKSIIEQSGWSLPRSD